MTRALDEWRHGTGEDEEMFQYNERGLDQLTDYERDGDVGVMFGNPADEDVDHLNIKAFIFAPRRKPVYRNPDGSSTGDLNNEHFAAGAVDPDFEDSVELIIRDLQRKFNGEIEIDIVDYPRPTLTLADYDWWMGLPDDVAMSDRFLVPVIKTLMDDVCRVHRGKVWREDFEFVIKVSIQSHKQNEPQGEGSDLNKALKKLREDVSVCEKEFGHLIKDSFVHLFFTF
ncbi:hypothetical protein K4K49_011815 [Colletotrichum sp. SAR 10_70]|nr:hypothetical protein K4K50_000616 [Colletotrichum sp. SAR 10_71]KAI8202155.1 hypothetical protein K4K49_011815 [Colletotrichum sp. SAR 10_70]KAI8215136.1 hypothetical protein K4K52_010871 [Colletotrichum sp. SAR 10_76]KAI8260413.1 hypothetical protein K4K53_002058 [Colletotrichum sp. SAR 10_77]KAJ5008381.1 hypothetical protein K4K48_003814 [Colletotrichum sp. SAR 10_66]